MMPNMMTATEIHNGLFTLYNPATGGHRTFRLRTWNRADGTRARVLGVLMGTNNEESSDDYVDFAFLRDAGSSAETGGFAVWKKWRGIGDYEALARVLWSMLTEGPGGPYARQGVTIRVSKRCVRCNRTLTTPESIRDGIGPECAGKE